MPGTRMKKCIDKYTSRKPKVLDLTDSRLKKIAADISAIAKAEEGFKYFGCRPCDTLECVYLLDRKTPLRQHFQGIFKESSGFLRVNIYFPAVIDNIIKNFHKEGDNADDEERSAVISSLKELKDEIRENKCWDMLFYGKSDDYLAWNCFLCGFFSGSWYTTVSLHAECYLYRKIFDIFCSSQIFNDYDYFEPEKSRYVREAALAFPFLTRHLMFIASEVSDEDLSEEEIKEKMDKRRTKFFRLLRLCLWADKYQRLCLKVEKFNVKESPLVKMRFWESNIISDDSLRAWASIEAESPAEYVDIIVGHTGLELFCNLCLAYYITELNLVSHVRFHVKSIPWAVYDATKADFENLLSLLKYSDEEDVAKIGEEWTNLIENGTWIISEHIYWTLPYDYDSLEKWHEELYEDLSRSSLIIFQGELHHRKLIGDINWRPDTPFCHALGRFHPAPLVSLRVIEMEIVCGIPLGVKEELDRRCCDWMLSGSFGVILFDAPVCKKEVEPSCVCEGQNPVSFCPTCPTAQKCRENNYLECK